MQLARFSVLCVGLGAISFWVPYLVLAWAWPEESLVRILSSNGILALSSAAVGLLLIRMTPEGSMRIAGAICCILGIWLTGPLAMSLRLALVSPDYALDWSFVLFATLLFPICTFSMSTYEMVLIGLLLASALIGLLPVLMAFKSPFVKSPPPRLPID